MENNRNFLKSERWDELNEIKTDREKKIPPPLPQKPYPKDAALIQLIKPENLTIGNISLLDAVNNRKSKRKFTDESLTLEELSLLLWVTQGVRKISGGGKLIRKTVPSGGSRHPFETYLCINRVDGVEPGLYRYLPFEHKLCFLKTDPDLSEKINTACDKQSFVGKGAVVFIWTAVPYRSEWCYSFVAHKMIAIEAGHVCQNLYLSCEAIGAGTCAIGDYNNKKIDTIIGVDGKDEFVIYIAPVGKVK